jgi:two-component system CAI-1 autoinducer sensor kinase/phosphatase CqsS
MSAAFALHSMVLSLLPATTSPPYGPHAALLGFCWLAAIVIGASSANLRREGVRKTRETLTIIAHELRTPLAATELLSKAVHDQAASLRSTRGSEFEADAGKLEEISQRISLSARSMNQRINALLLNSSDSARSAERSHLRASDLIRGALDKFPFPSRVKREFALLEIKEDFVYRASEALMAHVIDNLLSNATMALLVKDERIVTGDLVISISVDHANRNGIVRVIDKGAGMEKNVLDQAFEPFVTGNPEMRLGLGLAFCKQVISATGGKIGVESSTEYGTCVTLTLPLGKSVEGTT